MIIVWILVAAWFVALALFVVLRLHATKRRGLEPLDPAVASRSRSFAALRAAAARRQPATNASEPHPLAAGGARR